MIEGIFHYEGGFRQCLPIDSQRVIEKSTGKIRGTRDGSFLEGRLEATFWRGVFILDYLDCANWTAPL